MRPEYRFTSLCDAIQLSSGTGFALCACRFLQDGMAFRRAAAVRPGNRRIERLGGRVTGAAGA